MIRSVTIAALGATTIAALALPLAAQQAPAPTARPVQAAPVTPAAKTASVAKPGLDESVLHVQVILDHLGFAPGILDGREGMSLTAALNGFQESRGLPITGKIDPETLKALAQYREIRPTVTVTLDAAILAGPYTPNIPHGEDQQAKLPTLGYRDPMEKLGEMFHTTPDVIRELNPPGTKLAVGTKVVFPDAVTTGRNYDAKLKPEWRDTLAMLNVDSTQPSAAKIVVSKSKKVLRVLDADGKLVAQFQVTTGSTHDPLPLGTWKIYGADTNPKFHFNPALFWDAKKGEKKAMLPPGPNGPVGVVWLDLSKEHYGIHGTPEPSLIGRTESHGCVRLANWNAARLALMIKPGTPAVFEE